MSHRVGLEIGLPGSDVDYQKVTYDTQAFSLLVVPALYFVVMVS